MTTARSKVEVGDKEARYYDKFMSLLSLGRYSNVIKTSVQKMDIRPGQSILDLGSGTGKNDCFMAEKLWLPLRRAFIRWECQLAAEFLKLNLKDMLRKRGFNDFEEEFFFKGHLRFLKAVKGSTSIA